MPDHVQASLRTLVDLPEATLKQLCDALDALPVHLSGGDDVVAQIARVLEISRDQARQFAEVLFSLYFAIAKSRQDAPTAAARVIASLDTSQDAGSVDLERRTKNLSRLLGIGTLYVRQNAAGLLYERQNLFTDARILTDVRPVFRQSSSDSSAPAALIIIHTLRVTYQNVQGDEELFLAMDSADLRQLKELVERAQLKEGSLSIAIEKTGIPAIEPGK